MRHYPIGAELLEGRESSHFRVWAPRSKQVGVIFADNMMLDGASACGLVPEGNGYFSGIVVGAGVGTYYKYELDSGRYPDPASRFQPNGPHGPSQVIDSGLLTWKKTDWKGIRPEGQILYEMHIGTFTNEGTWSAAIRRLPHLVDLGVTVIELMPIADFPGRFGWGYDGVNFFAPTRLYGEPDDVRAFVDAAHSHGIGVILDVVYNHSGPDGNYLKEFSPDYFTDRYKSEWGEPFNFDGENNEPVREYFLTNAVYWIKEFHFDGFRLDATQQIFDQSKEYILTAISRAVRQAAGDRSVLLVGENEPQDGRLVRVESDVGGLDMLWNDDFHHSTIVALTGRREAYYMDYEGTPQELLSAAKRGFLYQGQHYCWQKKARGTPSLDLETWNFVNFLQNHDQVANSLYGYRIHRLTSPALFRMMTALLLLAPGTPLLFQGQEFAASAPFLYFADHHDELAKNVARGREEFLKQFASIADPDATAILPDPHNEEVFLKSKLDFGEVFQHREVYELHRDLIRMRKADLVIGGEKRQMIDGAVIGSDAFVIRYFGVEGDDRLLVFNLGRQFEFKPSPEPLVAPPVNQTWKQMWSSEDVKYGGEGIVPLHSTENWVFTSHSAVILYSANCTFRHDA